MKCTRWLGSTLVMGALVLIAPQNASAQAPEGGTVGPGEKKIYVGNLPFSATEEEVRDLFEEYGEVKDVAMMVNRDTGRPRGFAFVVMDRAAADSAIEGLNGRDIGGRSLRVSEVRPKGEPQPSRPPQNGHGDW